MEKLNAFFNDKCIDTILDVGTGSGRFIDVLKKAMPNAVITGIDPSLEAMKEAAKIYPDLTFKEMTGEELSFSDDSFNVASISMALHHLPDVGKTLAEMQRVVKKGGFIIVNELFSDNLNKAQEVHKLMHHFRSKVDRLCGVCHNESFTKAEILAMVKSSGLRILLHFENKKAVNPQTMLDVEGRKAKLHEMLDKVNDKPEYEMLAKEAENIIVAFQKHGFEMATRVVIIAEVA